MKLRVPARFPSSLSPSSVRWTRACWPGSRSLSVSAPTAERQRHPYLHPRSPEKTVKLIAVPASNGASNSSVARRRALVASQEQGTLSLVLLPDVFTIHNRYVPEWLHRIVNALLVASIWGTATGYLWLSASPGSFWKTTTSSALSLTPVILIAMIFVRYSVVRGVAGEEGYDELR